MVVFEEPSDLQAFPSVRIKDLSLSRVTLVRTRDLSLSRVSAHQERGFPVTILRFAGIYGPNRPLKTCPLVPLRRIARPQSGGVIVRI